MNASISFKKDGSPIAVSDRLLDAIEKRRTVREFSPDPLTLEQIAALLWSAQGVSKSERGRTTPSAGAMYAIELYVLASSVMGIPVGLYAYQAAEAKLECVFDKNIQPQIGLAVIDEQPWVESASAIIVVTANVREMNKRFAMQSPKGQRGSRYAYIETGALAQNVHLLASAMNLGMVLVGGFDDKKVKSLLGLPEELEPTALLCIGNRRNAN